MSTLEPIAMPEKISSDMEHTTDAPPTKKRGKSAAGDAARAISSPWASLAAIVIAVMWTIPTIGLLVTSFRKQRDINTSGWWTSFSDPSAYTLENYRQALSPGTSASLSQYFINTIVITIPAVLLPLFLASLAAYAFAWMPFPGRDALFVAVFALQIVPLQVALIPLLDRYVKFGLANSYWSVWLSHTIFALPLATFLIHNFMRELPAELMEAARVDGAGHVHDLLPDPAPAAHPGTGGVRHLPVPLGLERPARVAGLPGRHARRRADHRGHRLTLRNSRQCVVSAVRRCLRRDDRSGRGVPRAAAVLRTRPARRWVEGLTPARGKE